MITTFLESINTEAFFAIILFSALGASLPLIYEKFIRDMVITMEEFIIHWVINTMMGVSVCALCSRAVGEDLLVLTGIALISGMSGGNIFYIIGRLKIKGASIKTPFGEIKFDIDDDE